MDKRKLYSYSLISLSLIAVLFIGYVGIASLSPSEKSKSNAVLIINLGEITEGEARIYGGGSKPRVVVVHRTAEDITNLEAVTPYLKDPNSVDSKQPAFAVNYYRSLKPEYFIGYAYEPRMGVEIKYFVETYPTDWYRDITWFGGFYENYDGAHFDKAGRLYKGFGHPRQRNIPIPEYSFVSENVVAVTFLGEDT